MLTQGAIPTNSYCKYDNYVYKHRMVEMTLKKELEKISGILPILVFMFLFFLIANGYITIVIIISYFSLFLFLYLYRQIVSSIVSNKYMKYVLLVCIFFICRILAEKALNAQFSIEKQYINYSATLYAIFLIPGIIFIIMMLITALVGICFLLKSLLPSFMINALFPPSTSNQEKNNLIESFKFILIMLSAAALLLTFPYYALLDNDVKKIAIIADAYPVSDCGMLKDATLYIRKNDSTCYEINFNPKEYKMIEIQNIKTN